jgi:hypothetical protein
MKAHRHGFHDARAKTPLLAVSSAPSLYPVTLKTLGKKSPSRMEQTYFIPVDLLSGQRKRTSEALERLFAHLVVRFVQRRL